MEYEGIIFSVDNKENKKGSDIMKNEIKLKINDGDVIVKLEGEDEKVLGDLERKLRTTLTYNPDYSNVCNVEKRKSGKVDSDAQLFN
ncbi:MAG: hypothetical protein ACOCRO_10565 [Halanaerobiales bacterium]